MSAGLTVLAVDDERPALEDLARVLRASPLVDRVETASDGDQALVMLAAGRYDALFLDVRMPGLDGVDVARVLQRFAQPPAVVFVTAYESAAVEAFELRAVDYLVKPVARARLHAALERIAAEAGGADDAVIPGTRPPGGAGSVGSVADADVVPVDNVRGGGTRLVPRQSILYLQANGDYVRIHADDGRFLLRARMADIERRWEPFGFVRVHRGYVVNLRRAVEVRSRLNGTAAIVLADGSEVPISRRQVGELRRRLGA
ncbi:LytTR family DNA-binding domain-containing protein [Paraconexibacter antarcticus]|uniref:LytTR family DNA-binding domain-containing protein n=1 Tax=Paraconexibacter antarcticus TaxID=2949664 RepID=A0ABY5DWC1_9ACTN|nr:LytTR family DNA-binding domain-containing protein [Paraconexibacter antarcticus]UTI66308.1 LytTR family DNA-binding domain-containing protein [Paraconexibacter antarcticus]